MTVSNSTVSIIVPVYNVEAYLDECLRSIIRQTYQNIEIIVINDGSTDGCGAIIERYAHANKRIQVTTVQNGGLGKARNIGIEKATGDFIFFVDSDDFITDETIETLVNTIGSNDILIYNGFIYDHATQTKQDTRCFLNIEDDVLQQQKKNNNFRIYLSTQVIACLKLYRHDFILQNNIRFPVGIYGEDVEFWTRCLMATSHIKYIDYPGYLYRMRPHSIMSSGGNKNLKDRIFNFESLLLITRSDPAFTNEMFIYALNTWNAVLDQQDQSLIIATKKEFKRIRLKEQIMTSTLPTGIKLQYFFYNNPGKWHIYRNRFLRKLINTYNNERFTNFLFRLL